MSEDISNNHVVAVIDRPESARKAVEELEAAGYTEPIVFSGEKDAEKIDARGEYGGILDRIRGTVDDTLSEATNFLKQYEEEARSGKQVVAVPVENRDKAEPAREILFRNRAHNIRFFGKLAVTDLSVTTNPSPVSDSSPEQRAS